MKILVTGGAGYIGSHTVLEFALAGYEIVVIDNLVNSSFESIKRVEDISKKSIKCVEFNNTKYVNDSRALTYLSVSPRTNIFFTNKTETKNNSNLIQ